jgi:sugar lactone lactonase YvrE/signal transduction histidine kinase
LWVGNSEGAGVFRPDQGEFYFFPGLFPEAYAVHDIFRDRQDGIVWVCTSAGVLKYHPRGNLIRTVTIPPGLVRRPVTVNAFLPDRTDPSGHTWWLGLSHTGLLRWNRHTGAFALVRYPSGAAAETRWMTGRDDGTVWIGTNRWDYRGPGLFLFDPRKGRFLETPLTRLANRYFSVPFFMYGFVDLQKRLWIGNSDEGLHVLDEGLNREVTPWPPGAARHLARGNNLINDVHCDRRGRVWLATYRGVYYVAGDGSGFVSADSLTPSVRLEDPAANTVYTDRRGNLWAARWGSVTQMDPDGRILTVLTSRDGLYDRENKGLAEDRSGNLWIGNYEGLHCYQPATRRLLRFTVSEGLLGNNTTGRIAATPDGAEILVGQKNGFNVVQAAQLLRPHAPPALAISSFKIEEQEQNLDFGGGVSIRPGQNAFSVDFTALNYAKLHDNQYAYYLDGFEPAWRHRGPARRAYYANLDPGNYTLYVKAGDVLGNWNPRPLQLRIRVLPAYYQTGWFRLLAAGVGAGLLYALYRYRVRQLLRVQHVRDRISADLHDEIGTTLSGVGILGVMARKGLPDGHPAAPLLERMNEEVHQVSGALDDIVWSINPRNDQPDRLMARMTRYASELLEARQIECHLALPAQPEHLKLPMERRRDFYLFFKEVINNLAKYAGCTEAWIEISRHRQYLRLVVRDNGVGFHPEAPSERNGLRNLKKRAESLHGRLSIESLPGAGTTVRLEFPVPPAPKGLLTRRG